MTTKIIVEGFKSIGERVEVEVRPLTILDGANSSGKSSLMQALLLLKQTLEANYDPGPLLLNGPIVKFTAVEQLLHVGSTHADGFTSGFGLSDGTVFETQFEWSRSEKLLWVREFLLQFKSGLKRKLKPVMTSEEKREAAPKRIRHDSSRSSLHVVQARFALGLSLGNDDFTYKVPLFPIDLSALQDILHVPGLRGNPERSYPISASGPQFPGDFANYTASVILRWMKEDKSRLSQLCQHLKQLGLTWKVEAKKLDDAHVELRVGRLPRLAKGGARDMVNIADVGLGVPQVLPALVALLEANSGQLVHIEQPEIHLHAKAQVAMAGLLAEAAKRGVLVVVETHSSLLLLATQTLVAKGELSPDLVKLHWFERDKKSGATLITSRDLDEAGRFGDWPEDFDDVSLETEAKYLDAVEAKLARR